jgi:selT/selW/selH-like putative selenoprotein
LAAAIRASYPEAEIAMMPSSGGRFEVLLEGTPIFEKSKLRRHAQPGEVLTLIRRALPT